MSILVNEFSMRAASTPEKIAVWCDGEVLSYAELYDFVNKWTALMLDQGVARGDHIGVLLPNCIEFIALMLVCSKIGAVIVPLNTSLPAQAVLTAFRKSDVKHVVAYAYVIDELRSSGIEKDDIGGYWLAVDKPCVGVDDLQSGISRITSEKIEDYSKSDGTDPYILTMTSGSTGDPKPIVLTQKIKYERAMAAIELYGVSSEDKILAATPLYHSLAERLVLMPLLAGATSIVMPRFSYSEWLRCVKEQGVTFTIAVSSQLSQIDNILAEDKGIELDSLRCVVSSSALLEENVKSSLIKQLQCDFHECYGASEIAIATNLDPESSKVKLNSVGKALPNVSIRILGDDGEELGTGEVGEIACKTPMMFAGYYNLPDKTQESMADGYFKTGDLGRLDDDGFLYYLGRKKEVIISGGINIYPSDIDRVISAHDSVDEIAAFPLLDSQLGEVVAVAIVPKDVNEFSLKNIRRYCATNLADFQQPRKYFVIDELPRNAMGKIMRMKLPEMLGK